ncbi:Uncharacterized protein TCM_002775 [Theobroma cacao]|uniref:Uncharacterized protein n=1 Tax=Theobroma cacao TaxID=3641 RepID=A0A061DMA2_THECC|nr:Uncharacterized protein TCM_002775 [Theobroma cacao]
MKPSSQPEFDPKAWTKAIRGPTSTRIPIYKFGTHVLASKLLAAVATFEFACGPNDAPPPTLTPTLELKAYR